MARFKGIPPVTGTFGPVCIYKMYGRYFMRSRSSLTRKRVKRDPAFRKTMEYATLLGKASRIASAVYAGLPADQKQHALFRKLTGEAMTWLKYGWRQEEVLQWLQQCCLPQHISLFCEQRKKQELTIIAPSAEERALSRLQARRRVYLLRAIRRGNYSVLLDLST